MINGASLFDLQDVPVIANPRDEWYTPLWIIERARIAFGGDIDLDPASCELANRTVQAKRYISPPDDGLLHEWAGNVWINPPFSEAQTGAFVDKALASDCRWIMLVLAIATSRWWFRFWNNQNLCCAILSRNFENAVAFKRPDGSADKDAGATKVPALIALFSNLPRHDMTRGFGDIVRVR